MKVLNIGTSEMGYIEEGLKLVEEKKYGSYTVAKCMRLPQEDIDKEEYEVSHIRTTSKLLQDQRLQELCERCLSYFWDRLSIEGIDNPDVEWLAEDMGLNVEEFIELFHEAGFEEE